MQSRLAANQDEEEEPREELESSSAQASYAINHDVPQQLSESMNGEVPSLGNFSVVG